MVIDSSAIAAIFLGEPERGNFLALILQNETRQISAASVLEVGIVLESKRGESAGREFDLFVVKVNLEVVPVTAEQVEIARSAWRKYGKGRHRAALNFGDCFTYALAKIVDEPILANGHEFSLTDAQVL